MRYVRKAISALGGIFLAALLIAALAPKATRAIAAALVQVVNTPSNPVVTTDSLGTATLLQFSCQVSSTAGANGNSFSENCFTVPAGKRAVVENVDGFCGTPNGASISAASVTVAEPGVFDGVPHQIPLHFEGLSAFGFNNYDYNFPVRLYADPGQQFTVQLQTNDAAGETLCQMNITGRLLPTS